MKKMPCFLFLCALTACNNVSNSVEYGYHDRPYNPLGNPTNPTRPFDNDVVSSNENITGMVSRADAQISDYIKYRLNAWDFYNPDIGDDISRIDIANAAAWLTGDERTTEEIEQKFADNLTLMHMALYVIDNRLNSCFKDSVSDGAAACFVKWRDKNKEQFSAIREEIYKNTTLISVADAQIMATNDARIIFMLDSDGRISGATVTENGNTTNYNAWAHLSTDEQYAMLDKLMYVSAGKKLGLSYSDFGTYSIERDKIDKQTNEETTEIVLAPTPFAGGYASHKIAKSDIANNVDFTGYAVGNARKGEQAVDLRGTARLTFDKESGTSTLGADFHNWYDIIVKDDGTIEFSNYTNINNLARLDAAPDSSGLITGAGAKMDVEYYAPRPDTGVPTEATGLVQYSESPSGVQMDIAFGAKP